ncbi:2-C-methyl-D-erythritol 4-phosphate cytidylyltransferase [soil metagenome]
MPSSANSGAGAVIVAAGAGLRFGGAVRKQYVEVAGEPLLRRAVRPFAEHPGIAHVVIVLPPEDVASPPPWLAGLGSVVAGGEERTDSMRNGVEALSAEADPVLIHDGARPFPSRELIDRVLAVARHSPVLPALPATDTLKQVNADGRVLGTLDRDGVWLAQTPQGFPRQTLERLHACARHDGIHCTDDAALAERCGEPVRVVRGAAANLKVTHPEDLELAGALAAHFDLQRARIR